jgi:hypothetical protein
MKREFIDIETQSQDDRDGKADGDEETVTPGGRKIIKPALENGPISWRRRGEGDWRGRVPDKATRRGSEAPIGTWQIVAGTVGRVGVGRDGVAD